MLNEVNQVINITPSSEMPSYFSNPVWLILIDKKPRKSFPPLSHFCTSNKKYILHERKTVLMMYFKRKLKGVKLSS